MHHEDCHANHQVGPGSARDDRRGTRGHDAEVGEGVVACRERCTCQAAVARAEPGEPVGAEQIDGECAQSGDRQQRGVQFHARLPRLSVGDRLARSITHRLSAGVGARSHRQQSGGQRLLNQLCHRSGG